MTQNKSPEYINNLEFHYAETWSLQRGAEYEQWFKAAWPDLQEFRALKKRTGTLDAEKEVRLETLEQLAGRTQYLTDDEGQLHFSAHKINTFHAGSPEIAQLRNILQTEVQDVPLWMCAPVYRDGIIFYDSAHNKVSVLNICFSCDRMATDTIDFMEADVNAYKQLRTLFTTIGHPIEPK